MKLSRREALQIGGLSAVGAAALALPLGRSATGATPSLLASRNTPRPYAAAFRRLEVQTPQIGGDADGPIHTYEVTARPGTAQIVPGLTTPIFGYDGVLPGRRIDVDRGTRVRLTVRNRLPALHPTFRTPTSTSTHLHGSASLPQYDGYADDVTRPGQKKVYQWPNDQSARTLWYHDHVAHYTAQNVYSGLSAQYHLHDPVERALLPQGDFDVAMTISDMMFKANGTLLYDDRSHSGLWGDVILVNGRPWPVMKVQRRVYRFRVLVASLSRSYTLRLSDGAPVHMVATDGGLMPRTQSVTSWRQIGGERYEFLVDFRGYTPGQRIELRNSSNRNNRDYDHTNKVMAFEVTDEPVNTSDPTWNSIPDLLAGSDVMDLVANKDHKTRHIKVERTNGQWVLNGETWSEVVKSGYRKVLANPDLGDTEIWEFENSSGGWYHPMHIHLIDFKVLSRNGKPAFAYEQGPKDTVYVGEGETVKVIMNFGPHRGRYMVHCHNVPHEDHDMMHQFSVGLKDGEEDLNDPIKADPATDDPTP